MIKCANCGNQLMIGFNGIPNCITCNEKQRQLEEQIESEQEISENGYYVHDSEEESEKYIMKKGWGHCGTKYLSKLEIEAILNGKTLSWFDGEYTHCITLDKED